jgi:ribosome recycling factor
MNEVNDAKSKMGKAIDAFFDQIQGMRRGGLDAGFVETIKVLAYGQKTCVSHLAYVSEAQGRISIVPYDPNLVGPIATGLKESGLEAYKFSKTEVVVTKPPSSGEDRNKACDQIRRLGEDAKVSVRNIRKKCKQQLKRLKLDENELKGNENRLQEITDVAIEEIDQAINDKISQFKEEVGWPSSSKRKNK